MHTWRCARTGRTVVGSLGTRRSRSSANARAPSSIRPASTRCSRSSFTPTDRPPAHPSDGGRAWGFSAPMDRVVASVTNGAVHSDRVLALLQMQRELLATAASGAQARTVLELLVDLIEEYAPGATASVLMLAPETQTLHTLP